MAKQIETKKPKKKTESQIEKNIEKLAMEVNFETWTAFRAFLKVLFNNIDEQDIRVMVYEYSKDIKYRTWIMCRDLIWRNLDEPKRTELKDEMNRIIEQLS